MGTFPAGYYYKTIRICKVSESTISGYRLTIYEVIGIRVFQSVISCQLHQFLYLRILEITRFLDGYMSNQFARSLQKPIRIFQYCPLVEAKIEVVFIEWRVTKTITHFQGW